MHLFLAASPRTIRAFPSHRQCSSASLVPRCTCRRSERPVRRATAAACGVACGVFGGSLLGQCFRRHLGRASRLGRSPPCEPRAGSGCLLGGCCFIRQHCQYHRHCLRCSYLPRSGPRRPHSSSRRGAVRGGEGSSATSQSFVPRKLYPHTEERTRRAQVQLDTGQWRSKTHFEGVVVLCGMWSGCGWWWSTTVSTIRRTLCACAVYRAPTFVAYRTVLQPPPGMW